LDRNPRLTSGRVALAAVVVLLLCLLAADVVPGRALTSARANAKAAGMSIEYPKLLAIDDPKNAASIYVELANAMGGMSHEFRYADKKWPSREPALARRKREWFKPYLPRISAANAIETFHPAPDGRGETRLGDLIHCAMTEANWLASEGDTKGALRVTADCMEFVFRSRPFSSSTSEMINSLLWSIMASAVLEFAEREGTNAELRRGLAQLAVQYEPKLDLRATFQLRPAEVHEWMKKPEASSPLRFGPVRNLVEAKVVNNLVEQYRLIPKKAEDWPAAAAAFKATEDRQRNDSSQIAKLGQPYHFYPYKQLLDNSLDEWMRVRMRLLAVRIAGGNVPTPMPNDPFSGLPIVLTRLAKGFILEYPGNPSMAIKFGG
jgi:hypothetical protein